MESINTRSQFDNKKKYDIIFLEKRKEEKQKNK